MSFVMNPNQIKRREYLGLATLIAGVLALLIGMLCLLVSTAIGLLVAVLGLAVCTCGVVILHNIPDVMVQQEELWQGGP